MRALKYSRITVGETRPRSPRSTPYARKILFSGSGDEVERSGVVLSFRELVRGRVVQHDGREPGLRHHPVLHDEPVHVEVAHRTGRETIELEQQRATAKLLE
jgi:hypothetical protein